MPHDTQGRIGPQDLGGLDGDAVDPSEHDFAQWERMVDAMTRLMYREKIFGDAAQLREGIEALGPDVYQRLSYFERWAASSARKCVMEGLVTQEELDERIARIRERGRDGA